MKEAMKDALAGVGVVDLSVNAPGPFASKLLADLGADVISVVNPQQTAPVYAGAKTDPMLAARGGPSDVLLRGKTLRAIDLKSKAGRDDLLSVIAEADIVISEMRPGKLEALELGYDMLAQCNPRIILCEISGYGKHHPLALRAGHDINYLAHSGVLSLIRDKAGRPIVPQNIIGDYAAGGSLSVNVILAALYERERTGKGRQIALSMTAGIQYLMSDISAATLLAGHDCESWRSSLNGGMPTYDVYETSDGQWMAVGALEPKFITIIGEVLDWPQLSTLMGDVKSWPEARQGLVSRFKSRPRSEWTSIFDSTDACVAPVISLDELAHDGTIELGDVIC